MTNASSECTPARHGGPTPTRPLELLGFVALHYGRATPLSTLLAHVLYGAVAGAFYHVGA